MCGIVGWISAERGVDSFDRRKFIDQALILDTVRGGDSSGVFVVDHSKPAAGPWPNWRKQLGGGHEFVISSEYKKLFDNAKTSDYKFVVGHNRSATIGGVNVEAAHPFQDGPITLVHNGTVNNGEVESQRNEKGFVNDSQTICNMLTVDDPEKVVKQLDGAFALVWHDARDDSLNFVRNTQRPMHMAKAGGRDTIYFASEPEMLYWLDKRLGLKLQDIVSMKSAHLVKFTSPKLMVPEVKKLELHSPKAQAPVTTYQQQHWSGTGAASNGFPRTNSGHTTHVSPKTGQTKAPSFFSKQVPQQQQEDLMEYGLFVDSPEDFVPMSQTILNWHGAGSEDASVLGWLMPVDKTYNPIPAVIHGLAPTTYPMNQNRVWSVIPIGLSYIGWNLPIVTCRIKTATCDTNGQIRSIPANSMPPPIRPGIKYKARSVYQPKEELPRNEGEGDDPTFPGPGSRSLTKLEWLKATAGGCGDCGAMLTTTEHAWNLEWIATDTGNVPICAGCIEDRIQNPDDDLPAEVTLNIDPEGI